MYWCMLNSHWNCLSTMNTHNICFLLLFFFCCCLLWNYKEEIISVLFSGKRALSGGFLSSSEMKYASAKFDLCLCMHWNLFCIKKVKPKFVFIFQRFIWKGQTCILILVVCRDHAPGWQNFPWGMELLSSWSSGTQQTASCQAMCTMDISLHVAECLWPQWCSASFQRNL